MVFPKARLVVAGTLFLAWIGFLVYLVARTRNPVILSRPQLLVSNLVVLAEITRSDSRPARAIRVKEVLWAADKADEGLAGKDIHVDDLADCLEAEGWAGAGVYIVPLTKSKSVKEKDAVYQVTALPVVPGYRPKMRTIDLVSVGPNRAEVAGILKERLGIQAAALDDFEKSKGALVPLVLAHNMPEAEAVELQQTLAQAGAVARLHEAETRIYLATADALAQWREIVAEKGRP